jgi:hypothetical protein
VKQLLAISFELLADRAASPHFIKRAVGALEKLIAQS